VPNIFFLNFGLITQAKVRPKKKQVENKLKQEKGLTNLENEEETFLRL